MIHNSVSNLHQSNKRVTLAIFDLDNTLIAGDSDKAWGEFLFEKNIVSHDYLKKSNHFYKLYAEKQLDLNEYLEFSLTILKQYDKKFLYSLREEFIQVKIKPMVLKQAIEIINYHKQQEHILLIITATNKFITEPIAKLFNIKNLIAVELETTNNSYTGKIKGIPSFQEGKITRLQQWLQSNNLASKYSYFYSDSINDLPLLQAVNKPIVVNPDPRLLSHAKRNNWQQMDW